MGIDTVADLRDIDPRPVRKALTVVGERMIHDLRRLLPRARTGAGAA